MSLLSLNAEEYTIIRILLGIFFVVAGILHFLIPEVYMRIMPPYLPRHKSLIVVSGVAEVLGGVGLFIPATRRISAWGLVALLIAVMPANIYMATAHVSAPGILGESWAQWVRLPLQIPLIWWAWVCTRRPRGDEIKPA